MVQNYRTHRHVLENSSGHRPNRGDTVVVDARFRRNIPRSVALACELNYYCSISFKRDVIPISRAPKRSPGTSAKPEAAELFTTRLRISPTTTRGFHNGAVVDQ